MELRPAQGKRRAASEALKSSPKAAGGNCRLVGKLCFLVWYLRLAYCDGILFLESWPVKLTAAFVECIWHFSSWLSLNSFCSSWASMVVGFHDCHELPVLLLGCLLSWSPIGMSYGFTLEWLVKIMFYRILLWHSEPNHNRKIGFQSRLRCNTCQ